VGFDPMPVRMGMGGASGGSWEPCRVSTLDKEICLSKPILSSLEGCVAENLTPYWPQCLHHDHWNVVAELSPLSERPDFYRSQLPTIRDEHVVDMKRLVLMAVKKVGWARFGSLLLAMMRVVRADQTVAVE
jgi:hypothetical protein